MTNDSLFPVLARDVVARVGSQAALADIVGVRQQSVSEWCIKSKPIPPQHVLKVEAATGISRHALRPDIYPRDAATSPGVVGSPGAGGEGVAPRAHPAPAPVDESLSGLSA